MKKVTKPAPPPPKKRTTQFSLHPYPPPQTGNIFGSTHEVTEYMVSMKSGQYHTSSVKVLQNVIYKTNGRKNLYVILCMINNIIHMKCVYTW